MGTLPGVMNACCGHGDFGMVYVQFRDDRETIRGSEALRFIEREREMSSIIPRGKRVVVKVVEEDNTTKGGIVLPFGLKEHSIGEVVGINPNNVESEFRPGDKVIFRKYSGVEVQIDEQDLLIFKEEDILGVISE